MFAARFLLRDHHFAKEQKTSQINYRQKGPRVTALRLLPLRKCDTTWILSLIRGRTVRGKAQSAQRKKDRVRKIRTLCA
jgi:hypothetical protein